MGSIINHNNTVNHLEFLLRIALKLFIRRQMRRHRTLRQELNDQLMKNLIILLILVQ